MPRKKDKPSLEQSIARILETTGDDPDNRALQQMRKELNDLKHLVHKSGNSQDTTKRLRPRKRDAQPPFEYSTGNTTRGSYDARVIENVWRPFAAAGILYLYYSQIHTRFAEFSQKLIENKSLAQDNFTSAWPGYLYGPLAALALYASMYVLSKKVREEAASGGFAEYRFKPAVGGMVGGVAGAALGALGASFGAPELYIPATYAGVVIGTVVGSSK
jgi:hypothetical protein